MTAPVALAARDRSGGPDAAADTGSFTSARAGARRVPFAHQLDRCSDLLARHLAAAVQRFGSPALGVIDLPSLASGPGELAPDQIRAASVLYWASQVDDAGIPGFAEALAAGTALGRLLVPLTTGADRLMQYWRARHERFSAAERAALYQRLFGTPGDATHPFPSLMAALCGALGDIGRAREQDALAPLRARAAEQARELATLLTEEAVGITAFAGRDIIANIREAMAVLRDRDIAVSMGALGGGVWHMIRMHAPQVMGRAIDPEPHVEMAQAGLTILSWLADNAPRLEGGRVALDPTSPVVQAALEWQAAAGGA